MWTPRHARTALLALTAVLLLVDLGGIDLWAPDEPRYTQIAEELRSLRHGAPGLFLLRLNDEVYTQKPPLYFWAAALAGAPSGRVTEAAARLPSALAGIGVIALTLWFGRRLFGLRVALLGAALLLTVYEFGVSARRAQLDVMLACFELAALAGFWRLDRGWGSRGANLLLLHGAIGLAVLTKGPVGLLNPMLVVAAYLAWEGRLRELRRLLPPWGLALSLGPGLAWVAAAAALAPAGFLGDAVGENVLGRFFSGTSHARPFYYYLYQFPVEFLPWALVWPVVIWAALPALRNAADPDRARAWRWLLAWVGASLLFFSLSSGKRGEYLVPTFPAAALLCADALTIALASRAQPPRVLTFSAIGLAALLAGLGVATLLGVSRLEFVPDGFAAWLLAIVSSAGIAWSLLRRTGASPLALLRLVVATVFAVELGAYTLLFRGLDSEKSPRPIAEAALHWSPANEPIGLFRHAPLIGGLVYYSHRPVRLLADVDEARVFLSEAPRAVVVKKRNLAELQSAAPIEVRAQSRSGRRALVVVTQRGEADISRR